ncbi:hypothetical protein NE237_000181 [Protea cynaroides]|uniref:Pentatricopeptide repeat-containing protein n=1 Tax=Protea cynaroides TaxID=273540 RepID=A0A9Q0QX86_9MAGN|nr:hypothetical protein NE237_000181 [Protea cynaroides]
MAFITLDSRPHDHLAEQLSWLLLMLRYELWCNRQLLAFVQIHQLSGNFEPHIFVGSSLLDMYAKAGRIYEARGVFDRLPERDVVSCTAIIVGYAQLDLVEEAL